MNLKKHLPWLGALLPIANTQAETKPNVVISISMIWVSVT